MDPIVYTERGSPVYVLEGGWPPGSIPMTKRGLKDPPPSGRFAKYLHSLFNVGDCVIIKHKRATKIIKLWPEGEVYTITARALRPRDRAILTKQGILQKN